MVFRIRDKSLFWTKSGWKNNWEPKILNMPKPCNPNETAFVTTKKDHHSFLRSKNWFISVVQAYRNYSRVYKQYLYGDKKLEQAVQIELRSIFHLPFNCQTPVELIKQGGVKVILFRKKDSLTNWTGIWSWWLITIILSNFMLTNFRTTQSEDRMSKPSRKSKARPQEQKPSNKLSPRSYRRRQATCLKVST